jgi:hypothetical protein
MNDWPPNKTVERAEVFQNFDIHFGWCGSEQARL